MKKATKLFVMIMCAISLIACGTTTDKKGNEEEVKIQVPEAEVQAWLEAFAIADYETVFNSIDSLDSNNDIIQEFNDLLFNEAENFGEGYFDLIKHFLGFDFIINGITVDGDNATADVTIICYDYDQVVESAMTDIVNYAINNVDEISGFNEEDYEQLALTLLVDSVANAEKTVENEVSIKLTYKDGKWLFRESGTITIFEIIYEGLEGLA